MPAPKGIPKPPASQANRYADAPVLPLLHELNEPVGINQDTLEVLPHVLGETAVPVEPIKPKHAGGRPKKADHELKAPRKPPAQKREVKVGEPGRKLKQLLAGKKTRKDKGRGPLKMSPKKGDPPRNPWGRRGKSGKEGLSLKNSYREYMGQLDDDERDAIWRGLVMKGRMGDVPAIKLIIELNGEQVNEKVVIPDDGTRILIHMPAQET